MSNSVESSLPQDKISVATRLVRDLGVPLVMLVVVSWALYAGAAWVSNKVLLPTLEDNKALVKQQTAANQAMLESLNKITANIEQQTDLNHTNGMLLKSNGQELQTIKENTGRTAEELTRLREAMDKGGG